ncbi:DUF934 domain-containing protein [Proteobacteria bacterium 005FR1]|nr:DUF934 domain-containing protein [Proteobacteria bacterium 005FR1]
MRKLIKDGAVVTDDWQFVDADHGTVDALPVGKVIVPLALWLENKAELSKHLPKVGVWLNGEEDTAQLHDDVAQLPLIAVNFPVFTDGRGFSAGRLLRERHGFSGELRAVGNFLRDQLCYLRRCGFNAFSLNEKYDPQAALASLGDFSEYYQGAVDEPLPLFRRRALTS